jgi:signal transduction histidine kinase
VGPVLKDFHGVLTGVPTYHGHAVQRRLVSHGIAHPDLRAHRQDAPLAARVLALAAIDSHVCATLADWDRNWSGRRRRADGGRSPGAGRFQLLQSCVARQPDWSDLPIILLTHRGADSTSVRQRCRAGQPGLMERPVRTLTLITALHATLRARNKQYQAREAARRKDEFLASLGHELRNPLAPIRTSVSLLTHLYPDAAPVARIRDMVERQVRLLTRLVDDLLDVARITSGKITLQRSSHAGRGDEPRQRAVPAGGGGQAHPHRLATAGAGSDAAYRLCARGADHRQHPVQRRQVHAAGRPVTVRADTGDGTLLVSIRDNGIGLDADAIPRIFRMFEQSKTVNGQISSGLGIGLSLARQFAEMHGGTVDAYSDGAGRGSEFVIRLPVLDDEHAQHPNRYRRKQVRTATNAGAGGGRQPGRRRLADRPAEPGRLRRAHRVRRRGRHAAVEQQAPDMIIMDLGMPGMDGYETARAVRRSPAPNASCCWP